MSRLLGKAKRRDSASQGEMMSPIIDAVNDTKNEIEAHENALRTHEKENSRKRRAMFLEPSQMQELEDQIKYTLPDMDSLTISGPPDRDEAEVPIKYSTADRPFECKPSFQKGLGLFAPRPIAAGHLIFREAPLLCCSDHGLEKAASYLALSPANKIILDNLQSSCHCSAKGRSLRNCKESPLKHLWATNAFTMPSALNDCRFEDAAMPLAGIYAVASRLNHSCDPNAYYGFTSDGELRVWARRDIKAGEEITRSYLSVHGWQSLPIRGLRWHKLGFQCTCVMCITFPDLPLPTAEMVVSHPYYHAAGRVLADSQDAANCPLVEFVSKEEMGRFEKVEEWAASVQEDLMSRFEAFKLGSAVCMVVGDMPPALVITAMLMDLKDREWTWWAGQHLEYVLKTGPELSHGVLVSYIAGLPEHLTKKKHADLRELFMGILPEIARDLKEYKTPKTEAGEINQERLMKDLKRILGITHTNGAPWIFGEDSEENEERKDSKELCDHPGCMEQVGDNIGNEMI